MKRLIPILLLLVSGVAHAQTSSESECDLLRKYERTVNEKAPIKIDDMTELVGFRVNCDERVVNYIKRVLAYESQSKDGWEARKQRQHTQVHCNDRGLASQSGWTAMDTMYDKDFAHLITITTRPKDCDSVDAVTLPSDKGYDQAQNEIQKIELRASRAYQGLGVQLMDIIGEINEVSTALIYGDISESYAEEKQSVNLVNAYTILDDLNESIEEFVSLKIYEPIAQNIHRNYSNFLNNVSDKLTEMLGFAETTISAASEGNHDLLSQLWVSTLDRTILIMKGENATLLIPKSLLPENHPQHSYLESAIRTNSASMEFIKVIRGLYLFEVKTRMSAYLSSCKASLSHAREAVKKGQGVLPGYADRIRESTSEESGNFSYVNYLATFDNELSMIAFLDDVCTSMFDSINTSDDKIDYVKIDQVWKDWGTKLTLLSNERLSLQNKRTQRAIEDKFKD